MEKNVFRALFSAQVQRRALVVLSAGAASVLLWSGFTIAGVSSTKHNLGSLSPAEIRSTDTTEICVFCHTPHNANPSKPIWNKQDSGATYNVYESQTLAATMSPNSPNLGQPTGSSKLCLSCHDGTLALGSVLNLPGASEGGTLAVTGPGVTGGKFTTASTAYIGTDLRDDHPISFAYSDSVLNTELKSSPFTPDTVKLSGGNVQCTSCHDPHGTDFPRFLVATMANGTVCTACHDNRYWTTMPSIHKTSTATWNGTGTNPWHIDMGSAGYSDDTPATQSCFSCHKSHGGASGKPLLKGTNPSSQIVDEEWTCLNCHNGNVAAKNMNAEFDKTYLHDIKGASGQHVASRQSPGDPARESATRLNTNRHIECADCHNSHGTKAGNHTIGGTNGFLIASNLLGGWGVKPNPWASAGSASTTYSVVDFTTNTAGSDKLEGYLCLKCHSYYAFSSNPPYTPSGNANGSLAHTSDLSASFNVNNYAFHPVFVQGKNIPAVTANSNWPANSLGLTNTFRYVDFPGPGERTGFYNMTHTSTNTCSDCHGSDNDADPRGVHGSAEKWIMRQNETGTGTNKNFCYNCHRRDVYGDQDYNPPNANYSRVSHPVDGLSATVSNFYKSGVGTGNDSNYYGILCMTCHAGSYNTSTSDMKEGAHGSNAAAGASGDPLGYRMMNGACVTAHTRATRSDHSTPVRVQMTFKTSTDAVCKNSGLSIATGNYANYNCDTVADCSN